MRWRKQATGGLAAWMLWSLNVLGASGEGRPTADSERSAGVAYLTDALVEARCEADWYRARCERRLVEGRLPEMALSGDDLVVAEVNPALGLLITRRGWADGLRGGARYLVVREGRVIGRVRLVDVRPNVSGAVLEEETRRAPEAGDRLVLAGSPAE